MAAVTDPIVFFAARTTDGNSTAYPFNFPNKRAQFCVYGTFDTATLTLQFSPDGGTTYINAKDALGNDITFTSVTGNGAIIVQAPTGELMRCVLANDGATTSLTAEMKVM